MGKEVEVRLANELLQRLARQAGPGFVASALDSIDIFVEDNIGQGVHGAGDKLQALLRTFPSHCRKSGDD